MASQMHINCLEVWTSNLGLEILNPGLKTPDLGLKVEVHINTYNSDFKFQTGGLSWQKSH